MKASSLSFKGAVLCVIAGMAWGLHMAISDDHSAFPAHAHLNLVGWVSLFLIGIYYRLHPALERARSAHLQVWSWLVGTIVMAIGVGLVHTGTAAGEPLAAGGSLIVFASALLFAWLLFRTERADASVRPAAAPAE
jgi:drug/metabolite transporter (DMT)-like permease